MKAKQIITATLSLLISIVYLGQAVASDLVEIDAFPTLMAWWIHGQDYGLPIKQEIQAYGNIDDKWFVLAAGPTMRIPWTEIDIKIPAGFRLAAGPELPITHWVGKINFIGNLGPFQLTCIHDMAWGRENEDGQYPNVLFIKEILTWNDIGIRMDGLQIGGLGGPKLKDKPFSVHIGPFLSYTIVGKHQLQFFFGINVRNSKQKCLKVNYLFLKF